MTTRFRTTRTICVLHLFLAVISSTRLVDSLLVEEQPLTAEARLIHDLMANYKRHGRIARPVNDSSQPVKVQLGFRLMHLAVDEKAYVMKTSVWVRLRWYDQRLMWNKTERGVKYLTIPADHIWIPDIVLVNTDSPDREESATSLQVKYTGRIFWTPHRMYSSACLFDVTDYPYDRQTCHMWLQSSANIDGNLQLHPYYKSPFDLTTYMESFKHAVEWEILENKTEAFNHSREAGVVLMYANRRALRFTLTIQRRAGFKAYMLLWPSLILSFLTTVIFVLPPERPDRNTLAMSLFASFMFLLLIVNDTAPPSAASIPKLGLYYCCNLLVVILAVFASALVIGVSRKAELRKPVPRWMKKVCFQYLGRALCHTSRMHHLRTVESSIRRPKLRTVTPPSPHSEGPSSVQIDLNQQDLNQPYTRVIRHGHQQPPTALADERSPAGELDPSVLQVPAYVALQWKVLALILDRLFFVVFLLTNIICIALLYPKPSLKEWW